MAAIVYEGANLTWQRAKEFLVGVSASQASQKALLWAAKQWLATQKYNPKLSFLTFADADLTSANTGLLLGTGTPKLIAAFVIKNGAAIKSPSGAPTGTATVSYLKIADDATGTNTTSTWRVVLPMLAAGDESMWLYPQPSKAGTAFANGVAVVAETTAVGTTASTAGDAGPGFIIVSA